MRIYAFFVFQTPQALLENSPELAQAVMLRAEQSRVGILSCSSFVLTVNWLYILVPNLPTASFANFLGSQASALAPKESKNP